MGNSNIVTSVSVDWKFSITVVLFAHWKKKKKAFHMEMWNCCYQSLCGCYSFCNDSPISTIHHAPWGVTLLLDVRLYKFTTFTLLFPLTTELLLPAHIVPAFTSFSGKGMAGVCREWRQLLVGEWERSRGHGGEAEKGLGAEHPSQVPGRGRTLWIPTPVAFILFFLIRGKKKLI